MLYRMQQHATGWQVEMSVMFSQRLQFCLEMQNKLGYFLVLKLAAHAATR